MMRNTSLPAGLLFVSIVLATGVVGAQDAERENASPASVMLSSAALLGMPVHNDLGHSSATLEQLMIDPENGCIQMVVIALDGDGERTVAVPWDMLVVEADGSLRLVATEDALTEQASTDAEPPRSNDGDEETDRALANDSDDPAPSTAPAPAPAPAESSVRIERAAPAPSESTARSEPTQPQASYVPNESFSPRFDPDTVRAYQGVVVGTVVAPLGSGPDDLVVIVDVGGDEVRTHLGPDWYVDRMNVTIEPGDQVTFRGSTISLDGETVVLVTELSTSTQSIVLRRPDGSPVW